MDWTLPTVRTEGYQVHLLDDRKQLPNGSYVLENLCLAVYNDSGCHETGQSTGRSAKDRKARNAANVIS